jgi:hypothetical protein
LREALTRSDNDFVLSEPRSRDTRHRTGAAGFLIWCLRLAYRAAAYPNRVAAALLIGVLIAIVVNALALQQSRHPAPLFGRTIQMPSTPAPTQSSGATPLPVERPEPAAAAASSESEAQKPTTRDPIAQLLKGGSNMQLHQPPASVSLRKHAGQAPLATETKPLPPSRDQISELLKTNASQTSGSAPVAAPVEANKTVLAAQRALVKLGFVLKPDGVNGAATRQALEQFERDHNLPLKDELTPKILHELAAQSGLPIE